MLFSWLKNLKNTLTSPSGWKLASKFIFMLLLIWGALQTLLTYQAERIEKSLERAENSYYQFIREFGHDSERIRIGAISNIQNIMLRKAPASTKISMFDSFKLTLGFDIKQKPIYHLKIKKIFYNYIKSMGKNNPNWSLDEMELIIDILINIGNQGWYKAELNNEMTARKNGLTWLWESRIVTENDIPMSNLFSKVRLDKVDLANFDLTNADFSKAGLVESKLKYTKLMNVNLNNADLSKADLSFSRITNTQFTQAKLINTKFFNSIIENCGYKLVHLEHAEFADAEIANSHFQNAYLDNTDFFKSRHFIVDFSNASIKSADFSDVRLNKVIFHSTILDNSKFCYSKLSEVSFRLSSLENVDFSNCTLTKNIDFEGAYLKGSNFSGVKGIEMVDIWMDANISNVVGLSKELIKYIIGKGAVVIPSKKKWQAYKAAGRPHARWKEYSN